MSAAVFCIAIRTGYYQILRLGRGAELAELISLRLGAGARSF